MSTSSASSFDTHRGSSPGLPPTARALPSGRGGGKAPIDDRERVGAAAKVAFVVRVVLVGGAVTGLVVIGVDGDPHRQQAIAIVVAGSQHRARRARVRANELDLVDLRADRLAVLGAQAGTAPVRERLRFGARSALAVRPRRGLAGRVTRRGGARRRGRSGRGAGRRLV